jgi:hypothetical protein
LAEAKPLAYEFLFCCGISQLFKWQHAGMATSVAENKATSNDQWRVTATKVAASAADIKAMSNDQWADAFKAATVSRLFPEATPAQTSDPPFPFHAPSFLSPNLSVWDS